MGVGLGNKGLSVGWHGMRWDDDKPSRKDRKKIKKRKIKKLESHKKI